MMYRRRKDAALSTSSFEVRGGGEEVRGGEEVVVRGGGGEVWGALRV